MKKILWCNVLIIYTILFLSSISCKKEEIPVLTTTTISSITDISAKSGGNIIDEGSSTVIARGVCWSTESTPTINDSITIDGAGVGSFSSSISGLYGGTIYFVRAYATNNSGTGYGMAMSFTTSGEPPSVPEAYTIAATDLQLNSVTLKGIINAHYLPTTVTFEYGITTNYGSTITAIQSPVTGVTHRNVSTTITGLTLGTTYHYRIKAVNSFGITYGSDLTFTTLGQVPSVTTQVPTNIQLYSATLNGKVNANYLSTTVTFEYGATLSYGNEVTATQSPVTGATDSNVSASISNLILGTTYHYRIKAINSLGTTYGSDLTFTTLGQVPTVTSLAATNITSESVQLNGFVNANGLSTIVTFEYGITTNYGNAITATQSPVTGGTNTNVSVPITGLTLGTTYHYRIKAVNSLGASYSNDMTFSYLYYGATYQGGLVFYIDDTRQHGLVCTPSDLNSYTEWGCSGVLITGADGTAAGTGNQNTIDIVNGCSTEGIAAKICYDLDLNGYTDWFLPSKGELGLMFTNLKLNGLGGFAINYWSSTEGDSLTAWYYHFDGSGIQNKINKNNTIVVRAVRAF